ncbi:efflux transporter periplasmic adaptor subunit [Pseudoxanthomonas kalamensis DSM 18571]|uniref:efflux RND transporter periplasmic adaptor subunit n=1 Tax=Pseudoxanthomonas kalamensis TaxID=289483 RepID=UPI001390C1C4|nr:efflux RND transporter periplasmic adaptor subunit [Pseudoxanthomonas kalamensis]KAF1710576.1 efflux transporter periplasmic adaptor subunit [Pseudoxanthomonas kalamensis DSM 18571]
MNAPVRTIALGCVAALALAACKPQEQPAPPPPEVGVVKVAPKTIPLQRDLVGRLAPFRSSDVRARVSGVLLKRLYTEGSDVREGQPMFQIDPAPLQASLSAAQAALASAQASYTNAHVAAQRARQLAPQSFVSKADLDNAEAAERSAAAAVQQAQASVTSARINLGYALVASPIAGRAGKQQVTEGALVGQGEATLLTTVDQLDPLYVNFSMAANEYEQLRDASNVALAGKGEATVDVVLGDGRLYAHPGSLDFSDTVVDPATGAISMRARLPNPDHALLPGNFVTLKATLGERNNVFEVPQTGVLRDAASAYAYVIDNEGKVARRNLQLEGAKGDTWLVTSGLSAGDQVIVSGVQKVQDGAVAKPTPWQPPAAPGAQPGPPQPDAGAEDGAPDKAANAETGSKAE